MCIDINYTSTCGCRIAQQPWLEPCDKAEATKRNCWAASMTVTRKRPSEGNCLRHKKDGEEDKAKST